MGDYTTNERDNDDQPKWSYLGEDKIEYGKNFSTFHALHQ